MSSILLASDDLRAIAETLEKLSELLFDADGEWNLPLGVADFSIPLGRPDDAYNKEVIGYAVIDDGWIGFSFIDPHDKIGFNG